MPGVMRLLHGLENKTYEGHRDRVYVPDEAHWLKGAPAGAREKRAEILNRLKSVA